MSNEELLHEVRSLKEKILQQEKKIEELESRLLAQETKPASIELQDMTIEDFDRHLDSRLLRQIESHQMLGGLKVAIGATMVIQGTHNSNGGDSAATKEEDVTDGSYSIDLELEKEFEDYGKAFLHLETGDGAGVEDELKVFSNVDRDVDDSDNSIKITEVWYEHFFKTIPAALMFGKIDGTILIDTNEYANDETIQFLGRIFRNSPTIEFPDNAGGFRLNIEPVDFMDLQLLLMDADSDWEDIVNDIFFVTQLNFKPNLFGKTGNYRILGWLNDRDHIKWGNSTETKERGYGFGISFDQELADDVGAFLRYG